MQCTKLKTYMETGRVVFLPPSRIQPNPAQPRKVFPREHLEELAASIRIHGILQPLSVRRMETHFELIAGERRYRAAQLAGLREIPCIVMQMSDSESSLAALLENLQRQDLNYVEEAKAFSLLMTRFSMSQEQVAQAVGKSQSAVCNTLRLLRHSEPVLTKLLEGGLTQRHARALLKLDSETQKLSAISHITRNSLSVSQTERYIDSLLPKASPGEKLSSEARLKRNAGSNLSNSTTLQTCSNVDSAAVPLPSRLCRDTLSTCGTRQPLRLAKQACVLPTAAYTTPGLPLPPAAPRLVAPGEAFLSQLRHLIEESKLPITLSQAETDTHITLTLTIPK